MIRETKIEIEKLTMYIEEGERQIEKLKSELKWIHMLLGSPSLRTYFSGFVALSGGLTGLEFRESKIQEGLQLNYQQQALLRKMQDGQFSLLDRLQLQIENAVSLPAGFEYRQGDLFKDNINPVK